MQDHPQSAAMPPPRREPGSLPCMPMPDLPQPRFVRPAYYAVTVVDGHGRIAATSPLRTLGWKPKTVMAFAVAANRLITATRIEDAAQRADTAPRREITARGHVNLPLTTRRRADIVAGDRLLIAADTDTRTLWIFPPKTLALILHPYTHGQNPRP